MYILLSISHSLNQFLTASGNTSTFQCIHTSMRMHVLHNCNDGSEDDTPPSRALPLRAHELLQTATEPVEPLAQPPSTAQQRAQQVAQLAAVLHDTGFECGQRTEETSGVRLREAGLGLAAQLTHVEEAVGAEQP